ncbi:MAG TPA: flagellar export protein FliJ [Terriglobales bacterium]|nr:flagellar export protein FliJ [Terriglobales bacterium]
MKGFFFRLERILRLRSRAEREQTQVFGQALRAEQARREALEQAAARLERCEDQVSDALDSACPAGELRNLGLVMEAANRVVDSAARSHRDAVDRVQIEQDLLGRARMERRVVERLREKRHETWARETSREEQSEMDGVARGRWRKGGKSS